MLRETLASLILTSVLLALPASARAPQPDARPVESGLDGAVAYLPLVARAAAPRTINLTFQFSETVQPEGETRHLAVAFHSVACIDAYATRLDELTFGAPEANAAQGEGWFSNEVWPDAGGVEPIGPFQWVGGAQGQHASVSARQHGRPVV